MTSRGPVEVAKVNGLLGDPAVYAFFQRPGAAALFDLGTLDRLPNRELLRVRIVLVSHTHLDHFIGFDRLLRVNVPHHRPLELIGPPGLIANVQGKLRGYLWNLLGPEELVFVVHEVDVAGAVTSARLINGTGFAVEPWARAVLAEPGPIGPALPASPCAAFAAFEDGTRFEAVALDHKTPSIAYACQLPRRYHVREDALAASGFHPGPWIKELQHALSVNDGGRLIEVAGRKIGALELGAQLLESSAPRPLGYLTDAGFTRANLDRAVPLLRGVERFVCETNYRDVDVAKAIDRMHLTTRQAALIAVSAGVGALETFHISNLYADDAPAVVQEAAAFFAEYRALGAGELAARVEAELERAAAAGRPTTS